MRVANHIDLNLLSENLREPLLKIARIVHEAGGRAWVVGGAVRDLLLGINVKDVDVEVFGIPPKRLMDILAPHFRFDSCGLSFGVLKLQHLDIDVSLPRRESKRGIGHRGFLIDSDPSLSVPEAASRRDFTINAIYYDPLLDKLEDPFGGIGDLQDGVLKHVSDKFREDPLRVLRGMQFCARLDLTPAPETIALCRTMSLEDLPCERLFGEWEKLLVKGKNIAKGLAFLRETCWVNYFPELRHLIGCKQDPQWHPEGDVWNHTLLCLNAFAARRLNDAREDLIVGLAVLCHDFGKPATTRRSRGHIRSLGHDVAGVEPTLSFLRRLTNEESILREVPPLVTNHMQPFSLWRGHATDSAIRRLAARVVRIDRLIRVARADEEGRLPQPTPTPTPTPSPSPTPTPTPTPSPTPTPTPTPSPSALDFLAEAAERLRVADAAPKPILKGRDLINLGLKPSPQFGPILKKCFEAQLDGAFFDLPGAIAYFKKMKN